MSTVPAASTLPAIDLRSDTVTQPTDAMRDAMARAEVGDDVYLEDPSIRRLEEAAAAVVGKEAALFVATGTMANLLAAKCWTQPGEEVVVERTSHVVQFEMGGMAWFSGAFPRVLEGRRGILEPEEVRAAIRRDVPYYVARTGLVWVEDTHNCGGGSVYPLETLAATYEAARGKGVPVHMDGARLFNAAVAQGVRPAEIARHADSMMFSVSKALSAPVGSMLCGTRDFIERARRVRRVVGGGWRQAGILAAAALVGIETMVDRLAEDHETARSLARGLAGVPGIGIDPTTVETNIVIFRLTGGAEACTALVQGLKQRGVLVSQLSPDSIRLVTHRHIGPADVEAALSAVRQCLSG